MPRAYLSVALLAGVLLISPEVALAKDCPWNNPSDCARAAETAQNPIVAVIGAIIGWILAAISTKAYAGSAGRWFVTDKGLVIPIIVPKPGTTFQLPTVEETDNLLEKAGLKGKVKRLSPPSAESNCIGYVFGGDKIQIPNAETSKILSDNEYEAMQKPQKEDAVIYKDAQGNVKHAGTVVGVDPKGNPIIRSRWGPRGVSEHGPNDVPPTYGRPTYYRSGRKGGHQLNQREEQ